MFEDLQAELKRNSTSDKYCIKRRTRATDQYRLATLETYNF